MPTAIGEKVVEVQKLWKGLNLPDSFPTEGGNRSAPRRQKFQERH